MPPKIQPQSLVLNTTTQSVHGVKKMTHAGVLFPGTRKKRREKYILQIVRRLFHVFLRVKVD